jgi:hypothetical protein
VNNLSAEPTKVDYHPNWLRFMYVINIVLAAGFGIAYLISPGTMSSVLGVPNVEPLWAAGYAYSYMIALGIFGVLGLRSPLKFSASLLLQATGKIVWIAAVLTPAVAAGSVPTWALMLTGMFALWIVGDLVAVPWRHFIAK